MAVKVPTEVLEGITKVRDSGLTNMLDRPRVMELLSEFGFEEAARWVVAHKEEYAAGIFQGFEAE